MLILHNLYEGKFLDNVKNVSKKILHTVTEPVHAVYKIATDHDTRHRLTHELGHAIKSEVSETKNAIKTTGKVLTGKKTTKEERRNAINQGIDVAKTVGLGALASHVVAGGAAKALATLASPADEIIGAAADKPLRKFTDKISHGKYTHGILPSSFYHMKPIIKDNKK